MGVFHRRIRYGSLTPAFLQGRWHAYGEMWHGAVVKTRVSKRTWYFHLQFSPADYENLHFSDTIVCKNIENAGLADKLRNGYCFRTDVDEWSVLCNVMGSGFCAGFELSQFRLSQSSNSYITFIISVKAFLRNNSHILTIHRHFTFTILDGTHKNETNFPNPSASKHPCPFLSWLLHRRTGCFIYDRLIRTIVIMLQYKKCVCFAQKSFFQFSRLSS